MKIAITAKKVFNIVTMKKFIIAFLILVAEVGMAQTKGISFEKLSIDFGIVKEWKNDEAVFIFRNNTSSPIRVLPIHNAFDLEVRYPKEAILPGQSARITAVYYTDRAEFFLRKFPIYFSHSGEPTMLKIEGRIEKLHPSAFIECPNLHSAPKTIVEEKDIVLNVQIIDYETGMPIKNSQVSFTISNREVYNFKTNDIGAFEARIKFGEYQLFTRATGYEAKVEMHKLDEQTSFIQVRLKPNKVVEKIEEKPVATNPNIDENKTNKVQEIAQQAKEVNRERDTLIVEKIKRDTLLVEKNKTDTVFFNLKTQNDIDEEKKLKDKLEALELKLAEAEKTLQAQKNRELQNNIKPVEQIEIDVKTGELNKMIFKPNNIVFLLDVSGSMADGGKLKLMKGNIKRLVEVLRAEDKVSIITYNINAYETLPVTNANNKDKINAVIDSLRANGLTNGVKGLEKAYQFLEHHFIQEGNNQVIMVTDGKFTKTNAEENKLFDFVSLKSMNAMNLTVVGLGNDKDAVRRMRKLAENGKGNMISIENTINASYDYLLNEIKSNSRK